VRHEDHLVADLRVAETLSTRKPGLLVDHVVDAATSAQFVGGGGADRGDDVGSCFGHVVIVRGAAVAI
jgi:hypothetical protein